MAAADSPNQPPTPGIAPGRLLRFALVVTAFLLVVNAMVCATAGYFLGLAGWWAWQVGPAAVAVAFVASTILGFRHANAGLRVVYAFSAAWLGALNFAFFAALGCWVVEGIVWLASLPLPRFAIGESCFGLALLATVYGLVNAAWLRVTRITIRWPNLPREWEGRAAVLVTDVHLGHVSGPRFLRRIISRLRRLQPDVVLIGGDLFDGTTAELDRLVAPWQEYSAPWGIYYVTGNHDEFADRQIYLDAVGRTGVRVLNNEMVSVHGLQIVGVHDAELDNADELRAILRRAGLDPTRPSILLGHRPVNLAVAAEEGVALQLAGHTHGGQLWPWNLLVARIFGRFAYGLQRLGALQVYTSNGAGTWGPPLRVGTKSEIVLIRFQRGDPAA